MTAVRTSSRLIALAVAIVFAVGVLSGAAARHVSTGSTRYTALTEVFQAAIDTAAVVVVVWAGSLAVLPGVVGLYMASASIGVELARPNLQLLPYYLISGWPQIAALLVAAYSGFRMAAGLLTSGEPGLRREVSRLLAALLLALLGAPYSYLVSGLLGLT